MVATVTASSTAATNVIAVPEQAVLHTGLRDVVVVAMGNGYFQPREVKLGVAAGGFVQVLAGLRAQEHIVTSSQFLIDSESNLREAVKKLAAAPASSSDSVDIHTHTEDQKTADVNVSSGNKVLGPQKTCPVMGGAINKKLYVDYKGQRIYMCCPGCTDAIKKEPEKYIKVLADRGEAVERIGK
jgi:YHS domain-containing protein